jgi:hypothetical protein
MSSRRTRPANHASSCDNCRGGGDHEDAEIRRKVARRQWGPFGDRARIFCPFPAQACRAAACEARHQLDIFLLHAGDLCRYGDLIVGLGNLDLWPRRAYKIPPLRCDGNDEKRKASSMRRLISRCSVRNGLARSSRHRSGMKSRLLDQGMRSCSAMVPPCSGWGVNPARLRATRTWALAEQLSGHLRKNLVSCFEPFKRINLTSSAFNRSKLSNRVPC